MPNIFKVAMVFATTLCVLAGLSPYSVLAQDRASVVVGAVEDIDTGQSVEHVQVLLEELYRSTVSDHDGDFVLRDIPAGTFTLSAYRIGYEPLTRRVAVPEADTLYLTLRMTSTVLEAGEVVVEGSTVPDDQIGDPVLKIDGSRLRQQLATTIAETLDDEPGISMRSMGPAPARPVLRGLGGERLLVLEDGERTGDLSSTSSDHALVIDPMTAERIEILRGPAALVYGPNTLGGVVNVVRDYVPTHRPQTMHVHLSSQAQSVNRGYAGAASLSAPLGNSFAINTDASFREAQEVHTPQGVLENTELQSVNASLGTSFVQDWGYIGLAGSYYETQYGIPGGFVGAHPSGVSIDLDRHHVEAKAEVRTASQWIPILTGKGTYSRYFHQEFESNGSLGIEFGVLSYHGSLIARTAELGSIQEGAFGLWAEYRDYASGGFSFTPASKEWTVAGFAFQEIQLGQFSLEGGLRYDIRQVSPAETYTSDEIGFVEERSFGGLSASMTSAWSPRSELLIGITSMRSLRMPGIEELYSEGPHLAAYSFEIGNPRLGRETGYGTEIFARYQQGRFRASLATYINFIDNYIFPRDTGELNYRIYLPVYQYTGAQAQMVGGEVQASVEPVNHWHVDLSGSYVRGTLNDLDQPIPWIPPLQGGIGVQRKQSNLSLGATVKLASSQTRVGPFETPTDGYAVLDLHAQYHFTLGGILQTLDLSLENAANTEYRDHLSRVKSIMPEAGRNLRLLYKIYL